MIFRFLKIRSMVDALRRADIAHRLLRACPWCGRTLEKEEPWEPWKCRECGWS